MAAEAPAWTEPIPLLCRLGFHRWVPLALSFKEARRQLGLSFCRNCPATRHDLRH